MPQYRRRARRPDGTEVWVVLGPDGKYKEETTPQVAQPQVSQPQVSQPQPYSTGGFNTRQPPSEREKEWEETRPKTGREWSVEKTPWGMRPRRLTDMERYGQPREERNLYSAGIATKAREAASPIRQAEERRLELAGDYTGMQGDVSRIGKGFRGMFERRSPEETEEGLKQAKKIAFGSLLPEMEGTFNAPTTIKRELYNNLLRPIVSPAAIGAIGAIAPLATTAVGGAGLTALGIGIGAFEIPHAYSKGKEYLKTGDAETGAEAITSAIFGVGGIAMAPRAVARYIPGIIPATARGLGIANKTMVSKVGRIVDRFKKKPPTAPAPAIEGTELVLPSKQFRAGVGIDNDPMLEFAPGRIAERAVGKQRIDPMAGRAPAAIQRRGEAAYKQVVENAKNPPKKAVREVDEAVAELAQSANEYPVEVMEGWSKIFHDIAPEATAAVGRWGKWTRDTFHKWDSEVFTQGREFLTRTGPEGEKLALQMGNTRVRTDSFSSQHKHIANSALKNLSRKEQDQVWKYVEDPDLKLPHRAMQDAVEEIRVLTVKMGDVAEKAGVQVIDESGNVTRFQSWGPNFWPRKKDFTGIDPSLDKQGQILQWLLNAGMPRKQAIAEAAKKARQGADYEPPAHIRTGKEFKYRTGIDVMYEHIDSLAKAIAEAEYLESPGMIVKRGKMLEQMEKVRTELTTAGRQEDLHLVDEIVNSQFEHMDRTGHWGRMLTGLTSWQMFSKLSHFIISNTAGLSATYLNSARGEMNKAIFAWAKSLVPGSGRTRIERLATDAGVRGMNLKSVIEGFAQGGGGTVSRTVAKVYGLEKSENVVRTISSHVGAGTAKSHFKELQMVLERGKPLRRVDKGKRDQLKDLLLVDDTQLDKILKQTELSWEQEVVAGSRMAEMTQGLQEGMNLPSAWAATGDISGKDALFQMTLQFKKFAFQGTKSIKDAIKRDPKRNLIRMAIASQLMGETLGGAKTVAVGTVRGLAEGDIIKAIKKENEYRGQWIGFDSETEAGRIMNRLTVNMVDSWVGGMMLDILLSVARTGKGGPSEFLMGPSRSDYNILAGAVSGGGALRRLGQQAIKGFIPFLGKGLQRAWLPTRRQKHKTGGSGRIRRSRTGSSRGGGGRTRAPR